MSHLEHRDNRSLEEGEIDLREVAILLSKEWMRIVFLVILGVGLAFVISALQEPVYEARATAVIGFPTASSPGSLSPLRNGELSSKVMRRDIAEVLGMPPSSLPAVTLIVDRRDRTLVTITAQDSSPTEAMQAANAWADALVEYIHTRTLSDEVVSESRRRLEEANQDLIDYLTENNLTSLSWCELEMLTGIDVPKDVDCANASSYHRLTAQQLSELTSLFQMRSVAMDAYRVAVSQRTEMEYAFAVHPPAVLEYASLPTRPLRPKIEQNVLLGGTLGLVTGVMWALMREWRSQAGFS